MRNLVLSFLIAIISFTFLVNDVQAKRFGGGKSFGVSRQTSTFSKPSNNYAKTSPTASSAQPASKANRWLGPLAGLALGGVLASLFMGHGLGSGIFSWLLLAGGIFMIWNFLRARRQPSTQPPMQNIMHHSDMESAARPANKPFFGSQSNVNSIPLRDSTFDEAAFIRNAKSLFIRLQTAYDNKNLGDIREFTAPEVYAEIQLQLQERGDKVNFTEVININAELLDLTQETDLTIASVQFVGQVREEHNSSIENIKEVWHLHRYSGQATWLVAGIQQA